MSPGHPPGYDGTLSLISQQRGDREIEASWVYLQDRQYNLGIVFSGSAKEELKA